MRIIIYFIITSFILSCDQSHKDRFISDIFGSKYIYENKECAYFYLPSPKFEYFPFMSLTNVMLVRGNKLYSILPPLKENCGTTSVINLDVNPVKRNNSECNVFIYPFLDMSIFVGDSVLYRERKIKLIDKRTFFDDSVFTFELTIDKNMDIYSYNFSKKYGFVGAWRGYIDLGIKHVEYFIGLVDFKSLDKKKYRTDGMRYLKTEGKVDINYIKTTREILKRYSDDISDSFHDN